MLAEGEGVELSSAEAQQFSRLRPCQLGLTLHDVWQERQDLNLQLSVLETDALPELSYAPTRTFSARGRTRTYGCSEELLIYSQVP